MFPRVCMKNIFFVSLIMVRTLVGCDHQASAEEKIAFLKKTIGIGDHDLVFDVGANVGEMTKLYVGCGSNVVCFDPQPNCVESLKAAFGQNENVIIEPKGLGAQDGILEFYVSPLSVISSFSRDWIEHSRFSSGHTWDQKIQAKVTTLDKMIDKYGMPKFCKIDVEGFEYEVIKGLTRPIPVISFELTAELFDLASRQIVDYLKVLGYKSFNFVFANNAAFYWDESCSPDVFIEKMEELKQHNDCTGGLWGDAYAMYQ